MSRRRQSGGSAFQNSAGERKSKCSDLYYYCCVYFCRQPVAFRLTSFYRKKNLPPAAGDSFSCSAELCQTARKQHIQGKIWRIFRLKKDILLNGCCGNRILFVPLRKGSENNSRPSHAKSKIMQLNAINSRRIGSATVASLGTIVNQNLFAAKKGV